MTCIYGNYRVGTRSEEFFFLVASFRFGCDFFFYKKLEVEDLHESFPGFAFLILIFFLTWKDCSIFWNLECRCFDSAIQQVSVYICGSVTYHLYR